MTKIHRTKEYANIHHWIRTNFGSPGICEMPSCPGKSKVFDWALKKGKIHEKNRDNYLRLCRSCHIKYDWNEDKTKRVVKDTHTPEANATRNVYLKSKTNRKRIARVNSEPIIGTFPNGSKIKFSSFTLAAKHIGVKPCSISRAVKEPGRTSKGIVFTRVN